MRGFYMFSENVSTSFQTKIAFLPTNQTKGLTQRVTLLPPYQPSHFHPLAKELLPEKAYLRMVPTLAGGGKRLLKTEETNFVIAPA